MKELSKEEKAKRYDEAIEKGKQIQNTPYTAHWDIMKEVAEHLLPELKESEDERIRKEIISAIKEDWPGHKDWISWLESQGETSPVLSNSSNIGKVEQKPDWSEEDEERLQSCHNILQAKGFMGPTDTINTKWLKSLKDRVQPQPKQEWSEEDEQYLLVCKNALAKYQTTDKWDACIISQWLENKLKSLRLQNTWKPSEGQMKVCKEVYADLLSAKGFDVGTINSELNRLEEELRKLK